MDKLPEIEENVVESIEENVEEEPLPDVPEIKEKEIISQDEIFTSKKKTDVPEIKKVKKPKREISEAQRERLKKGREKALANRRAKAELKRKEKEEKKVKFEESKSSIPPELVEEFKKSAVTSPKPPPTPQISKDEILELTAKASQKALEDYEIVRKKRKAEKKKIEAEEKHRQQVRQTIQNAVKGPQRDTTFDFCFA